MPAEQVRIAIVNDHAGAAGFMAGYLRSSFEVGGSVGCGEQAVELVRKLRPHVTLLDIDLGEENGLALVKPLTRLHTGVLLFTTHEDETLRALAIKSGAKGLISLAETVGKFVEAIHTVAVGGKWFPEPGSPSPGLRMLGSQRLEVVRLLRDGKINKQIAAKLGLGIGAIEFHIRTIKSILGVATQAEIVGEAIRRGYIPPPGLDDESLIMTPLPK